MHTVHTGLQMTDRTLTCTGNLFQGVCICAPAGITSSDHKSRLESLDFHAEPIPIHSPLLREYYLVYVPPLTYMLKFSRFPGLTSCLGMSMSQDKMACAHATQWMNTFNVAHAKHPKTRCVNVAEATLKHQHANLRNEESRGSQE